MIGRAGELACPLVESVLGAALFRAALAGRPLRWVGDLDQPIAPTYVGDFARVLAILGDRENVSDDDLGRVRHVPHPTPTTVRGFVRTLKRQTGTRTPAFAVGSGVARALSLLWPLARRGAELVYQFEMPFVVDGSEFSRRFDVFTPTPYESGISRTVAWYRNPVPAPDAAHTARRTVLRSGRPASRPIAPIGAAASRDVKPTPTGPSSRTPHQVTAPARSSA